MDDGGRVVQARGPAAGARGPSWKRRAVGYAAPRGAYSRRDVRSRVRLDRPQSGHRAEPRAPARPSQPLSRLAASNLIKSRVTGRRRRADARFTLTREVVHHRPREMALPPRRARPEVAYPAVKAAWPALWACPTGRVTSDRRTPLCSRRADQASRPEVLRSRSRFHKRRWWRPVPPAGSRRQGNSTSRRTRSRRSRGSSAGEPV